MKQEVVEADVLCIGGGIAGLMGAIRAGELGAKVVVAEKANSVRSGAGATGNDHFTVYIPEIQGKELDQIKARLRSRWNQDLMNLWLEKSFEMVKLWDSWGIPMKYNGHYEFAGHAIPGQSLVHIKYQGGNQKKVLTKKALGNGAKIINRVMGFELLRDGDKIVGALGVDTWEDKLIIFRAKSVILGSGHSNRLYPSPTPAWLFNTPFSPVCTGDTQAMVYRIEGELAGGEEGVRHRGPKYFARCGQATWIGVFKDPHGNPIGPWPTKIDRHYSPALTELATQVLEDYPRSGNGPIYLDGAGMSDEDYEYMLHWLRNEGNSGLVDYMAEEGIDTRKTPVEFMRYPPRSGAGIRINTKSETSVKGLYAGGDNTRGLGEMVGAAVHGWVAGGNAAAYARESGLPDLKNVNEKIEEKKKLLEDIQRRETGASWQEVNIALQQIMADYAGYSGGFGAGGVRSDTMLTAGLKYLRRLKEKVNKTLMARNQHELMRCLETINLLDLGELVFIAARERQETRGSFIRSDYRFSDPTLDGKEIILNKEGDKISTRWEKR